MWFGVFVYDVMYLYLLLWFGLIVFGVFVVLLYLLIDDVCVVCLVLGCVVWV